VTKEGDTGWREKFKGLGDQGVDHKKGPGAVFFVGGGGKEKRGGGGVSIKRKKECLGVWGSTVVNGQAAEDEVKMANVLNRGVYGGAYPGGRTGWGA